MGYRQIAEMISLKYEVNISKENARLALLHVDPDGVRNRRRNAIKRRVYESKGPGDIYYIDGNDKLIKWGICKKWGNRWFQQKTIMAQSCNYQQQSYCNC